MSEMTLSSDQYRVSDLLEAIEMYFEKGWTDGLPVVPPTEKKVREFIEYVDRSPAEVLGTVPVRLRTITVEKVAINAVMAGCLPQYMPVILAAVEAMCDEGYHLHGSAASTGGAATLLIVNGPIIDKLNINSGANLFGPGWRANATIGRALRLFMMNVCGAIPGTFDKSTMGHPGKYIYCIAERASESPWEPYHVEKGFAPETSTVTVIPALGPHQMEDNHSSTAEALISTLAGDITALGHYVRHGYAGYGLRYCVVVLSVEHRSIIARQGWTKKQVKDYLYQRSTHSVAELKGCGLIPGIIDSGDEDKIVPAISTADEIIVIAAGGGGPFSACISPWGADFTSAVTKAIVPTNEN